MVTIILIILFIVSLVGWFILTRVKVEGGVELPNGKLHLYKDYILVIDNSEGKPKIKFAWVLDVDGNDVTVRFADSGLKGTVEWNPDKNNFYVKSKD